ncbi:MAG TPA: ABC transporter ATP-binding protein [Ktedonobacterales bacterium]|jgi:ABC-2 type transport system ATP-binding protein|nr:ABC transporter ATP-binding protein [Ktedonobacterales bacterium]
MMVADSEGSTHAPPEAPAIEIDNLVVRYGPRRAVDGLNLRVPRGSVYGLLGANGAGKTSTIKALMGFRAPSSGGARILGYDITHDRVEINARLGYVSETNSLYLGMTVTQLCAYFRATARHWNQSLVDRYLRLFGLTTNARARRFSKGMRTQLALCLALGSEPDLLILDEPTTGLDPVARRAFLNVLIGEVAAAGKTVFFSSHILSDVETVVDHVSILRAGRLLVADELATLKQCHAVVHLLYAEPPSDEAAASLARVPGVMQLQREERSVRVRLSGDVTASIATIRGLSPSPISVDTSYLSLDDIFLSYMQESQV